MRSILRAGALPALALVAFGMSPDARAEDKPVTGIPEDSIEQGWSDGDIALRRHPVADIADVVIDAENFLHDHHRTF